MNKTTGMNKNMKLMVAAGIATAVMVAPYSAFAAENDDTEIKVPIEFQDQINPQADGVGDDLKTDTDEDRRADLEKKFGIKLSDSDRWVDKKGQFTPEGDPYTSHADLKAMGTYGINASRQELIKYGIRTDDWGPYDAFTAMNSGSEDDLVEDEVPMTPLEPSTPIEEEVEEEVEMTPLEPSTPIEKEEEKEEEEEEVVLLDFKDSKINIGDKVELDLNKYFDNADNSLIYTVTNDGKGVATSEKLDLSKEGVVLYTLTGAKQGTSTVTVVALDEATDKEVTKTFKVTVENRAIEMIQITDQTSTLADANVVIDLKAYFTDADNDKLKFTLTVDGDGENYNLSEDGTSLIINNTLAGTSTITITANDGNGSEVTQSFKSVIKHEERKVTNTPNDFITDPAEDVVVNNDVDVTVDEDDGTIVPYSYINKGDKLPQTGSEEGSLTGPLGMLLVGLGTALGLVRRKK